MFVEKKAFILVFFVFILMFVGTFVTVIMPLLDKSLSTAAPGAKDYNDLEKEGRRVYIREGCVYCHTQQVRSLLEETKRYGMGEEETFKRFGVRTLVQAPPSQPGEYVYDRPHLLGTKRTGPDVARVGGKYDNSWHISHLRDPRSTAPGSIMPSFTWLFDKKGQPTEEAKALVAYLQKLGTNIKWREQGVALYKAQHPAETGKANAPEPGGEAAVEDSAGKEAEKPAREAEKPAVESGKDKEDIK